jgi:hypothetical protein
VRRGAVSLNRVLLHGVLCRKAHGASEIFLAVAAFAMRVGGRR